MLENWTQFMYLPTRFHSDSLSIPLRVDYILHISAYSPHQPRSVGHSSLGVAQLGGSGLIYLSHPVSNGNDVRGSVKHRTSQKGFKQMLIFHGVVDLLLRVFLYGLAHLVFAVDYLANLGFNYVPIGCRMAVP